MVEQEVARRSRSTSCSAGHDGAASSGSSNSFSIHAEIQVLRWRDSTRLRSGQTLPATVPGGGGASARTAISRVIVLHGGGARSRSQRRAPRSGGRRLHLGEPEVRRAAVALARSGRDAAVGRDQRQARPRAASRRRTERAAARPSTARTARAAPRSRRRPRRRRRNPGRARATEREAATRPKRLRRQAACWKHLRPPASLDFPSTIIANALAEIMAKIHLQANHDADRLPIHLNCSSTNHFLSLSEHLPWAWPSGPNGRQARRQVPPVRTGATALLRGR